MKWNRKKLLAAVTSLGYKSDTPDLDSIKAFLDQENIELADADGPVDVEAAFAYEADEQEPPKTKTRVMFQQADDPAELAQLKRDAKAYRELRQATEVSSLRNVDVKVGAYVRAHATESQIKSYNAKDRSKRSFVDAENAILFGVWAKSVLAPKMMTDDDHALLRKANITTTNTSGGALVPNDFVADLIDLKEERGVGRKAVPPVPMARETLTFPRRTGGLTVYYPGEATSITESNPSFNNVTMVATKMATLTQVSSELLNDSALSMGDIVAREIAYAFADKEDDDLFNGDGTSTYGGRTGLRQALKGLSGTIANIAGLFVGSGNAYSELEITDFNGTAGLLPVYVKSPKWYMHKRFYETVCGRIAARPGASGGAGGATESEITSYRLSGNPTWLGYPVEFVQVMPRAEANSQVCALFGDLSMAAKQGVVNGSMEIATSEHYGFNTDVLTIRGTQRHALVVHDPGNASSTESLRVPGPYVGLITAAS